MGAEEARRLIDQRVVEVCAKIADHRRSRLPCQILAEIEQDATDKKHEDEKNRYFDHRALAQPHLRRFDRQSFDQAIQEFGVFIFGGCRLLRGPGEQQIVDHRFEGCHDKGHHCAGDGQHHRCGHHLPQVGAHVSDNSPQLGHSQMVTLRPPSWVNGNKAIRLFG